MTVSISGTNGVTFPDSSLQTAAASPFGLKNRIINGDMRIDQRNAGASLTPVDSQYSLDRFACYLSQSSKYTVQQSSTAPTGFTNSLKVTSSSAYTVGASDYFALVQYIEGYNVADLSFGSASAKTITISFWVQSSLTGTFGGAIRNSAANRIYPFSYAISAANTWEQKTITIAGDTTGTWLTNNGIGIAVWFGLGVGSTYSDTAGAWTTKASTISATSAVSVVGTNGATFYITGVQLELGTSATPFERRMYGQELALCQRYYQIAKSNVNVAATSTSINGVIPLLVQLRSDSITVGKTSGAFSMGDMVSAGYTSTSTPTDSGYINNSLSVSFNLAGFSSLTSYRTYRHEPNSTNPALFTVSAEL
jgi:hypothetical protein